MFYLSPQTSGSSANVTSLFRTVTILSDTGGRVEEVYVRNNQYVYEGEPIFRLDTSRQQVAVETAYRRIANALVIRIQTLLLPIRVLLFPG